MGSDEAKIEKKRLKAEQKMAKKMAKAEEKEDNQLTEEQPDTTRVPEAKVETAVRPIQNKPEQAPRIIVKMPKVPWYRDPRWISVIIGAISLSIVLISIFTDWL